MREWAIVSELSGAVLNISTTGGSPPYCTEGQKAVPIENVPLEKLKNYQYWNERP